MKKVKLEVDGMGCMGCVTTVQDKLLALPGVKEARVSLKPPEAVVKYDPDKVSLEKLLAATAGVGYPARLKEELGSE